MEDVAIARRLFTVEEYCALWDAGILGEDDRVELIEGEIITMPPIGPPHMSSVNRFTMLFAPFLPGRAIVSVQNVLQVNDRSLPQPDLVLLRHRDDFYGKRLPDVRLGDVLLVVEVAHSSIRYDRQVKLPLYARTGVPELWIVAVEEDVLEVYRRPEAGGYAERSVFSRGDRVHPEAFPDVDLAVADLLP